MAYAAYSAALTRVRELLVGGFGSLRPITSTRFQGDLPDGLLAEEEARRGILAEIPIEVIYLGRKPHPSRLVITGNVQIHLVEMQVNVVRTRAIDAQVDDATRDAISAAAIEDGEAIEQVLEWPYNLETTQAGASTGLMAIRFMQTTSPAELTVEAGQAQVVKTKHLLQATIKSAPASS
jgi:hypothetical protein